MILSDSSIEALGDSLIQPFNRAQLQPASYDLQLGFIRVENHLEDSGLIQPGEFLLASTLEVVLLPSHIVGRIEGKSSWARRGLIIHTAGFVDPGFRGTLTLEITNLSAKPLYLKRFDLIAQIAFSYLDRPAVNPYGSPGLNSHYQNQLGPEPAWQDR